MDGDGITGGYCECPNTVEYWAVQSAAEGWEKAVAAGMCSATAVELGRADLKIYTNSRAAPIDCPADCYAAEGTGDVEGSYTGNGEKYQVKGGGDLTILTIHCMTPTLSPYVVPGCGGEPTSSPFLLFSP